MKLKGFIKINHDLYMMREPDKIVKLVLLACEGDKVAPQSRVLVEVLHPVHGSIDKASFYHTRYPKSRGTDISPDMTHAIFKYIRLFDSDYHDG